MDIQKIAPITVPRRRDDDGKCEFLLDAGSRSTDLRHEIARASNISFTIFPNRLGYPERRIYQFHEQLDRVLGDQVRTNLRVPSVLASYTV